MSVGASTGAGTGASTGDGTDERVLEVAVVQAASSLDPHANRAAVADLVAASVAGAPAGLVVLPEAFARDFGEAGSDVSPFAEARDGAFSKALDAAARAASTTVVAGMFEAGDDPARPFNTLLVRGAAHAAYRKIHLYDSFGYRESDRLSAGPAEPVVVDVGGFAVGLMTCYDLRFPELARDLVGRGAEVLVVPAAWVAGPRKVEHWRTLARARAIENTAYVVAAGQPGPRYTGHSLVIDPHGEVLVEAGPGDAGSATGAVEVLHATLRGEVLADARSGNPSLRNRRM